MKPRIILIYLTIFVTVCALVSLGFSVSHITDIIKLKRNGIVTIGTVKSIRTQYVHEGGPVTVYNIEFRTIEGAKIDITNQFSVNDKRYKIGEKVEVFYLENDSTNARIKSYRETYETIFLSSLMAILLMSLSGVLIFNFKRIETFLTKNFSSIDFS